MDQAVRVDDEPRAHAARGAGIAVVGAVGHAAEERRELGREAAARRAALSAGGLREAARHRDLDDRRALLRDQVGEVGERTLRRCRDGRGDGQATVAAVASGAAPYRSAAIAPRPNAPAIARATALRLNTDDCMEISLRGRAGGRPVRQR
jgi:hypothetical protein